MVKVLSESLAPPLMKLGIHLSVKDCHKRCGQSMIAAIQASSQVPRIPQTIDQAMKLDRASEWTITRSPESNQGCVKSATCARAFVMPRFVTAAWTLPFATASMRSTVFGNSWYCETTPSFLCCRLLPKLYGHSRTAIVALCDEWRTDIHADLN